MRARALACATTYTHLQVANMAAPIAGESYTQRDTMNTSARSADPHATPTPSRTETARNDIYARSREARGAMFE